MKTKHAIFTLGLLSILVSFGLGIQTAGELETVEHSSAIGSGLMGDINQDLVVDVRDAILILEIVEKEKTPTAENLLSDPDQDGTLTVADAMTVLREISSNVLQ